MLVASLVSFVVVILSMLFADQLYLMSLKIKGRLSGGVITEDAVIVKDDRFNRNTLWEANRIT
jgi:hypothetical protein